jgi:hypothetical protein
MSTNFSLESLKGRLLGKPKQTVVNNIKMDLGEMVRSCKHVMNLQVS